jgi:hypothetical protein
MLELGLPIHGVRFYRRGRVFAALSLADIHPKYPFMPMARLQIHFQTEPKLTVTINETN